MAKHKKSKKEEGDGFLPFETAYVPSLPALLRRTLEYCGLFPERVVLLDVETTGLSHYYDEITMVGWASNKRYRAFIAGDGAQELYETLRASDVLITYNGVRFDAKFLKKLFPDLPFPREYLDLMYLCRRVGLTGGQKAIEEELGLADRAGVENLSGAIADMDGATMQ